MLQFHEFHFRKGNHDDRTEKGEEEKNMSEDMPEILEVEIFATLLLIIRDKSLAFTVVTVRSGSHCCVLRPVFGRSVITGARFLDIHFPWLTDPMGKSVVSASRFNIQVI